MITTDQIEEWYRNEYIPQIRAKGEVYYNEYMRIKALLGDASPNDLFQIHGIETVKEDGLFYLQKGDIKIPRPKLSTYILNGLPTSTLYDGIKESFGINDDRFKI